ncbi:MAG: hypothetical protein KF866_12930 [Phycisphaeraceae bacterium]|nr:hypothetical protein [Phycisphaeraceae bacterium]
MKLGVAIGALVIAGGALAWHFDVFGTKRPPKLAPPTEQEQQQLAEMEKEFDQPMRRQIENAPGTERSGK